MTDKTDTAPCLLQRKRDFVLTIVIPCFNEEDVIEKTYEHLSKTLTNRDFELRLLFVDDGSVDKTGDILKQIQSCDARVETMSLSRNFGHQAAISAGLASADGDVVGVMDADLQDPPEVILEMLQKWQEGFDVVYGIKRKRKEAKWKILCYAAFYRVFRSLTSIKLPLDAGDFSVIDRAVLNELNRLPEKNRFFRGLRAWVGFRQTGVLYERDIRAAGVSKYSLYKLTTLAADGIFNFSMRPLNFVLYLGLTITFLSFFLTLIVLYIKMTGNSIFGIHSGDLQGAVSLIVVILLVGGIQLVSVGILGEYIGRIYQEVKGRPYYIRRPTPISPRTTPDVTRTKEPKS